MIYALVETMGGGGGGGRERGGVFVEAQGRSICVMKKVKVVFGKAEPHARNQRDVHVE